MSRMRARSPVLFVQVTLVPGATVMLGGWKPPGSAEIAAVPVTLQPLGVPVEPGVTVVVVPAVTVDPGVPVVPAVTVEPGVVVVPGVPVPAVTVLPGVEVVPAVTVEPGVVVVPAVIVEPGVEVVPAVTVEPGVPVT
jgi:hypothetical protein